MKNALIAMVVMFMLVVFPCSGVWTLLSHLVGGGAAESFLYPIYGGIVLLAGLIVGCTSLILDEIKALREKIDGSDDK